MTKIRKEYNPDRASRRKRRPVIYIVCEGKETETNYFRHFRSRYCLVDVVPISSKYTAAEHLVKHIGALISHVDYFPKDGDQIWCVFDCDENSDAALRNAAEYAKQKGYHIAYSNPCFEYWYLLHFTRQNGYMKDADEVLRLLQRKGRLEKYTKSQDVFEELLPGQSAAIQRAKERLEQLDQDHIMILSQASNPVTTVHELVEYLNSQKAEHTEIIQ